ncbi:2'-5' RNA ligase family protein [Nocardioides sp. YIM 152315]|uniref:2'-5' RNA ligase family protein n=1 Tax=Nocardioides sp. YIM 152315 TaxID=3031760 RepID=UPI0023DAB508|nr:2'-5' RNA ligase family protein [Nocardioides sp. YIM 152315]MDF1602004.1 2'-5' RNA ligase family protein [Nocardioides sp. YIM 152315]
MAHPPAHTVLVVPVPELEGFVRERTEHYDASLLSADPAFVHAHITVLGPFLTDPSPTDLAEVAGIVADLAAFDFRLERLDEFADGIIHLLADPDDGFRELTRRLVASFPQCPPYAGAFAEPVPHLTLDQRASGISLESVRAALGDVVPAACRADRVALHRYANHDCRVLADWKLGVG